MEPVGADGTAKYRLLEVSPLFVASQSCYKNRIHHDRISLDALPFGTDAVGQRTWKVADVWVGVDWPGCGRGRYGNFQTDGSQWIGHGAAPGPVAARAVAVRRFHSVPGQALC